MLVYETQQIKLILTGRPRNNGHELVGKFLHICVSLFDKYFYFLIFFSLYLQSDPLFLLYKYWIASKLANNVVFKLCFHGARLLQLIPAMMGCHLICKVIILFTIVPLTFLDCIAHIGRRVGNISHFRKGDNLLAKHKGLEIILAMGDDMFCLVSCSMALGSAVAVLFNFVSLKMYDLIPMPIYLFFPSVAVLNYCHMAILLPIVIYVYENDKKIVQQWNYFCHRSANVKLLRRQVKATKVLRMYGGLLGYRLYQLRKEVKPRYFYETVYYTITAMFSISVGK